MEALRGLGRPLTWRELHAVNTATPDELSDMRLAQRRDWARSEAGRSADVAEAKRDLALELARRMGEEARRGGR